MKIVAIETAGAESSVALADFSDDAISFSTQRRLSHRNAAAELIPALQSMLQEAAWQPSEIEGVAVTAGPGSFTGVRIGLATAKGLVESRNVPLLAVSSLALLAAQHTSDGERCALLDAGRGELYAARFPAAHEALISASGIAEFCAAAPVVICESSVQGALAGLGIPTQQVGPPDAIALAKFAAPQLIAGKRSDPATLDANYLRRAEAEARRDAGLFP